MSPAEGGSYHGIESQVTSTCPLFPQPCPALTNGSVLGCIGPGNASSDRPWRLPLALAADLILSPPPSFPARHAFSSSLPAVPLPQLPPLRGGRTRLSPTSIFDDDDNVHRRRPPDHRAALLSDHRAYGGGGSCAPAASSSPSLGYRSHRVLSSSSRIHPQTIRTTGGDASSHSVPSYGRGDRHPHAFPDKDGPPNFFSSSSFFSSCDVLRHILNHLRS